MKKFFRVSDVVARLFHRSAQNVFTPVRRGLGGRNRKVSSAAVHRLVRRLTMENLEDRQLLSVTTAEYEAIRSAYEGFALPETMADLNVIEICDTNAYTLQKAVDDAALTVENDLIVIRGDGTGAAFNMGNSPLVINIDSANYGDLTIAALTGTTQEITSNSLNVISVESGTVNIGGLTLIGDGSIEGVTVDTLVTAGDGAAVNTSRLLLSVRNETLDGERYTVDYKFNETQGVLIAGLSNDELDNFQLALSAAVSGSFEVSEFRDATLTQTTSQMKWAADAANMLSYTKWANEDNGFSKTGTSYSHQEDVVLRYYTDNFTNGAGSTYQGLNWFFTKSFTPESGGSEFTGTGGGLHTDVNFSNFCYTIDVNSLESMQRVEEALKAGAAVGVDFTHKTDLSEFRDAVSIWGYYYDTSKEGTPEYYTKLICSDLGDYYGKTNYVLKWNEAEGEKPGYYSFSEFGTIYHPLIEFTVLNSAKSLKSVTITGDDFYVGTTVTADVISATDDPYEAVKDGKVDYIWYRTNGTVTTEIVSARGSQTYTLQLADAGCYLTVKAVGKMEFTNTVTSPKTTKIQIFVESVDFTNSNQDIAVGDSLKAEFIARSVDSKDVNVTYQWYRVGTAGTTPITGAQSATYTVQEGDFDYQLKVTVTPIDPAYATGGMVTKTSSNKVTHAIETVTFSEKDFNVKQIVEAVVSPSAAATANEVTYQWYRVDAEGTETEIKDATGAKYELVNADAGYRIKVTATGIGHYSRSASHTSSVIVMTGIENAAISGDLVYDSTKTCTLTAMPTPSEAADHSTYEWYCLGIDDPVGTERTFTLTEDYVGKQLLVKIIGKEDEGFRGSAISELSAKVTRALESATIVGKVAAGETLTADIIPAKCIEDNAVTYKWYTSEEETGAPRTLLAEVTGRTLTLSDDLIAKYAEQDILNNYIIVEVTAKENGLYSGMVSDATRKGPTELTSVAITGDALVGETLTAAVSPEWAYADYVWYKSTADGGWEQVGTGTTLEVSASFKGLSLKVTATGDLMKDSKGTVSAVTEIVTQDIQSAAYTGNAVYQSSRQTLTAYVPGMADAVVTYQWYDAAGNKIDGAEGASFEINDAKYIGQKLTVEVTGVKASGFSGTYTATTETVTCVLEGFTLNVGQTDTVKAGDTLSVTKINVSETEEAPVSATVEYQWYYVDSTSGFKTEIEDATGSSYQVKKTDAGKQIACGVVGTGLYSLDLVQNAGTAAVCPVTAVSVVSDSGLYTDSNIVKAVLDAGIPSDSVNYQWYRVKDDAGMEGQPAGEIIDKATGSSYQLQQGDRGYKVYVVISQKSDAYPVDGEVESNRTQMVQCVIPLITINGIIGKGSLKANLSVTPKVTDAEKETLTYTWYAAPDNDSPKENWEQLGTGEELPLTQYIDYVNYYLIVEVTAQPGSVFSGTGTTTRKDGAYQWMTPFLIKPGSTTRESPRFVVGETIQAYPNRVGSSYVWYYGTDASGASKTKIDGASGTTLELTEAYIGKYITVEITGGTDTKTGMEYTGTGRCTSTCIVRKEFDITETPATEPAVFGDSLEVACDDPDATAEYQWTISDGSTTTVLTTEKLAELKLTNTDWIGKKITVTVTGTGNYIVKQSQDYSEPLRTELSYSFASPAADLSEGTGTVSKETPAAGDTITAVFKLRGDADIPEGAQVKYQCYQVNANGTEIILSGNGADTASYTVQNSDVGYQLRCRITGTETTVWRYAEGKSEPEQTFGLNYTEENTVTTNIVPVSIDEAGAYLDGLNINHQAEFGTTISVAYLNRPDATATYQWYYWNSATSSWNEITGASEKSLTLDNKLYLGAGIKVEITGTNYFYGTQTLNAGVVYPMDSVSISGKMLVGETLTADPLPYDAVDAGALTYQWYSKAEGENWTAIENATSKTYTLTANEAHCQIRVVVKGNEVYTTPSGGIEAEADGEVGIPLDSVVIEGTVEFGSTLTAVISPASEEEYVTYQWYNEKHEIKDATDKSFKITDTSLIGQKITVQVTHTSGVYLATTNEAVTATITSAAIDNPSPNVGDELTAIVRIQNSKKLPKNATVLYEWTRIDASGNFITVGTEQKYTVQEEDRGCLLMLKVTGEGSYIGSEAVATNIYTVDSVNISGTLRVGKTVTANVVMEDGSTLDDPAIGTYTWYRKKDSESTWTVIKGATESTYKLTSADRGSHIRVKYAGNGEDVTTPAAGVKYTTAATVVEKVKAVTIEGFAYFGETLTAVANPNVETDMIEFYWYLAGDDETVIGMGETFEISDTAYIGQKIKVVAVGTEEFIGEQWAETDTITCDVIYAEPYYNYPLTVGDTIAVVVTIPGDIQIPEDAGVSYRWYRVNAEGTKTAIAGADTLTYTTTKADAGYSLRFEVTAAEGGYYRAEDIYCTTYMVTDPIQSVTINGELIVGKTLTAVLSPEEAMSSDTVTYQWYRLKDGKASKISGAVNREYELTGDDRGYQMRVVVKGNEVYTTTERGVRFTTAESVVEVISPVTLEGDAVYSKMLKAVIDPQYTAEEADYKWFTVSYNESGEEVEEEITWAAGRTELVLSTTDFIGKQIRVKVNGIGEYIGDAADTSSVVVGEVHHVTLTADTMEVGSEISANVYLSSTAPMPAEGTVTYEWFRIDADGNYESAGGNEAVYTVQEADAGYSIYCVVNGYGNYVGEDVTSDLTAMATYPLQSVTIDGQLIVGEELTAVVAPAQAAESEKYPISYQWFRRANGGSWEAIEGADKMTYTLTSDDRGCWIQIDVSGNDVYTGFAAKDSEGTVVEDVLSVSISGKVEFGQKLTAVVSPADATVNYQWFIDGKAVKNATKKTFTISSADYIGKNITVEVTGTGDFVGRAETVPVLVKCDLQTAAVILDNTNPVIHTIDSDVITASVKLNDTTALPEDAAVSYQWYRVNADGEETAITGAEAASYQVTGDDAGFTLKCKVTGDGTVYINDQFAATGMATYPLESVTIDGQLIVGEELTAVVAPAQAAESEKYPISYQWFRRANGGSWEAIEGADKMTYTLTSADRGCWIQIDVSGNDVYTGFIAKDSEGTVVENVLSVSISGKVEFGQKLTAVVSPADATVNYQWFIDGNAVKNATKKTFKISNADYIGKNITVEVTGTGDFVGRAETDPVLVKCDLQTAAVILDNTNPVIHTIDSDVITASVKLNDTTALPEDAAVSYQWYRVDADGAETEITGAEAASYQVTGDDAGFTLKCKVTGDGTVYINDQFAATDMATYPLEDVTITGDLYVGETLTANTVPGRAADSVSYQWYRKAEGGSWALIGDASGMTYTLTADDRGCFIQVNVKGNEVYTGTAYKTAEAAILEKITAVEITGTAQYGATLTADAYGYDHTLTESVTYQWYAGATAIENATGKTFTVSEAYIGKRLSVKVTGTGDFEGTAEARTKKVTCDLSKAKMSLDITNPRVDDVVTATVKLADSKGKFKVDLPADATVTYQWYRVDAEGAETEITGAVETSYQVTAEDAGYALLCVAKGEGFYLNQTSAATDPTVHPLESVTISGDMTVGKTLTATVNPPEAQQTESVTYQWFRKVEGGTWSRIDNATENTYTLTPDDRGMYIRVDATGNEVYTGKVTAITSGTVVEKISSVTIEGNPVFGEKLYAVVNPDYAADSVEYAWYVYGDDTTVLSTEQSFRITNINLIGKELKVVVTGYGDFKGERYALTDTITAKLQEEALLDYAQPLVVGDTITATVMISKSTELPEDATVKFQWYWKTVDAEEEDWEMIDGQTGKTYTVAAEHAGHVFKFEAVGNGYYKGTAKAETDMATYPLESVTITGDLAVGKTLTAIVDPSQAAAEITYQWYRLSKDDGASWEMIDKATSGTYTLTTADRGCYMRVDAIGNEVYTGQKSATTDETVVEKLRSISTLINMDIVNGTVVTTSLVPASAEGSVQYQWYHGNKADGSDKQIINGATDADFVMSDTTYAGQYLTVVAVGTGDYIGTVKATTDSVLYYMLKEGDLTIDGGDPTVGKKLTAVLPEGAAASIKWYRVNAKTGKETLAGSGTTYTVKDSDVDCQLKVTATGKESAYITGSLEVYTDAAKIALSKIILSSYEVQVGDTITSALKPVGAVAQYQWYCDGQILTSETDSSIVVKEDYRGKSLYVVAEAKEGTQYIGSVTSEEAVVSNEADPDAPIVSFTKEDYYVQEGCTIYMAGLLDSEQLADEDVAYYWDFSGNEIVDKENFKRGSSSLYLTPETLGLEAGDHTVRLYGMNKDTGSIGEVAETTLHIIGINEASASFESATLNDGSILKVNFNVTPPGGKMIAKWVINWGDGQSTVSELCTNTLVGAHYFGTPGQEYAITLTVTDTAGRVSNFDIMKYSYEAPVSDGTAAMEEAVPAAAPIQAAVADEIAEDTAAAIRYWNELPNIDATVGKADSYQTFLLTDRAIAAPKAMMIDKELLTELLAAELDAEKEAQPETAADTFDGTWNLDFVENAAAETGRAASAELDSAIFDEEDDLTNFF